MCFMVMFGDVRMGVPGYTMSAPRYNTMGVAIGPLPLTLGVAIGALPSTLVTRSINHDVAAARPPLPTLASVSNDADPDDYDGFMIPVLLRLLRRLRTLVGRPCAVIFGMCWDILGRLGVCVARPKRNIGAADPKTPRKKLEQGDDHVVEVDGSEADQGEPADNDTAQQRDAVAEVRESRKTRRNTVPEPVRFGWRTLARRPEDWLDIGLAPAASFMCDDHEQCSCELCADVNAAINDYLLAFPASGQRLGQLQTVLTAVAYRYKTARLDQKMIEYLRHELAVHGGNADPALARVVSAFDARAAFSVLAD